MRCSNSPVESYTRDEIPLFHQCVGMEGVQRGHLSPGSLPQAQSLSSATNRECQGLGLKVHGLWWAACPAALFSSPKESNSPFLPGCLVFCCQNQQDPFSPPFHCLFLRNRLGTIWLSLPRVTRFSLILQPFSQLVPCLFLSLDTAQEESPSIRTQNRSSLLPPSAQKSSRPLTDTSLSCSWPTAPGTHIPGLFLIFGQGHLRCLRSSLTQKSSNNSFQKYLVVFFFPAGGRERSMDISLTKKTEFRRHYRKSTWWFSNWQRPKSYWIQGPRDEEEKQGEKRQKPGKTPLFGWLWVFSKYFQRLVWLLA